MLGTLLQIVLCSVCCTYVDARDDDSKYAGMWDISRDLKTEFQHMDWDGNSKLDMEERRMKNKLPTNPKPGGRSIPTPDIVTGEITSTSLEVFIVLPLTVQIHQYRNRSYYQLNYTATDPSSQSRGIDIELAAMRTTHVVLTRLIPNTEYLIKVSLNMGQDEGIATEMRVRTRKSETPRAPDVHVLRVTDCDVTLLFTILPGSANITKYKLVFYDHRFSKDIRWIQVDKASADEGKTTTYLLDNLYPDRRYFITVTSLDNNIVGSSTHLIVSTDPTLPILVVQAVTSESAIISVKPIVDANMTPLDYRVMVHRRGHYNKSHHIFVQECQDINMCEITIKDLLGDYSYTVKVSEKMGNEYGPAGVTTFTTEPPTIPGPVRIVSQYLSSKRNSYLLRWRRTTTGGSRIRGYVIKYVKVKRLVDVWAKLYEHGRWEEIQISSGDTYYYRIKGLHGNWRYKVLMIAKNALGDSYVTHFSFRTRL